MSVVAVELLAPEGPYAGQLQRIKQAILGHYPPGRTRKRPLLEQAIADAERHHAGQFRKSGEPVIIHPFRVALLAAEAGLDEESVIVALLHDIIEDTEVTKDEIRTRYGEWMADVVDGLTKVARSDDRGPRPRMETFRKLVISTIKDIRTLLVKILDRLDNMRDLFHLDRRRQRRIASETLGVYVPLAERMGLQDIADELTALCFRFLYPKRFAHTLDDLKARIAAEEAQVEETRQALLVTLKPLRLSDVTVEPRYHNVSEAILMPRPELGTLREMRVVVATASACYTAMGALHMSRRVVPNSIRDYISNPKPNRYQALESELFVDEDVVRISITSQKMERANRWGILANWKHSHDELTRYYQNYLELIDELGSDSDLRMDDVVRYAQVETVQAFTPRGEPLNFPHGATVLDFAYAIHTDLGNHCSAGLVSGRKASRFSELRDGDRVVALTDLKLQPREDWLDHVQTTRAKIQIRRALRALSLARAEEVGRELFATELSRLNLDPDATQIRPEFQSALEVRGLTAPRFFQKVGNRTLHLRRFLRDAGLVSAKKIRRRESWERSILSRYLMPMFRTPDPDLRVRVHGDVFVRTAQCCAPLHGDPITGVQREHGVSVHRRDCNMLVSVEQEMIVSVGWELDQRETPHHLAVTVDDQAGTFYKIGKIMHEANVNIHDITTHRDPVAGQATINIDIEPIKAKTYQRIITRLRGLKEVQAVQ